MTDIDEFLVSAKARLLQDKVRADTGGLVKRLNRSAELAPFTANRKALLSQGRIEALDSQVIAGRRVVVHGFIDVPPEFQPPPPEAA